MTTVLQCLQIKGGHSPGSIPPHPYGSKPGPATKTSWQRSLLLNDLADQGLLAGWVPANLCQGNDDIAKLGVFEPLL